MTMEYDTSRRYSAVSSNDHLGNVSGGALANDVQTISKKYASTPALVVDDSRPMRLLISAHLKAVGFTNIDQADSGLSAIGQLQQKKYGIVFTDWEMPGMGGADFIKALRRDPKTHRVPVVLISANATQSRAWLAGADAFLRKPFNDRDLRAAVQIVLLDRLGPVTSTV